MRKINVLLFSLLLLFVVSFVFKDQAVSDVGFRQLSSHFMIEQQTKMPIAVWYPTQAKAQPYKFGSIEMKVAENAKIKDHRYGLVIFSHGSGGSHFGHRDTAHYLAAHGYVVAAVLHPENNFQNNSGARKAKNWINRPQHISKAIDEILSNEDLHQSIDQNKIAVIGHSAGGYTALVLAGGLPDPELVYTHCNNHNDPEFCGYSHVISGITNWIASKVNKPEKNYDHLSDARVRAAVLLAPVGALFNHTHSLTNVNVPIKIYRSEKDSVLRYPYHAELIKSRLPRPPEFTVVQNSGHYSYISPPPKSIKGRHSEIAKDPEKFDRKHFIDKLNVEILEFLDKSLQ